MEQSDSAVKIYPGPASNGMMRKMRIASVLALLLLSLAGVAAAQGGLEYTPLEPLKPCTAQNCLNEYPDVVGYLNTAYGALLTLGTLFAVVTFTIGGVVYMTSDAVGKKSAAIDRMKSALWGLLLLAASVLILRTINPNLITFDLRSLPALLGGSSTGQSGASTQNQQQQVTYYYKWDGGCERQTFNVIDTAGIIGWGQTHPGASQTPC